MTEVLVKKYARWWYVPKEARAAFGDDVLLSDGRAAVMRSVVEQGLTPLGEPVAEIREPGPMFDPDEDPMLVAWVRCYQAPSVT